MRKVEVTFYLMRHGFCNCFGELTPEGRKGVEENAKKNLKGIKFKEAYSSIEARARDTAMIILYITKNNHLEIKSRRGLNLNEDFLILREIKSIASEVARDSSLDGRDNCNVMVVTHSANILACSRACPTLTKVNYADMVKLVVRVTDNLQEIVTTQHIPAPRLVSAAIS